MTHCHHGHDFPIIIVINLINHIEALILMTMMLCFLNIDVAWPWRHMEPVISKSDWSAEAFRGPRQLQLRRPGSFRVHHIGGDHLQFEDT